MRTATYDLETIRSRLLTAVACVVLLAGWTTLAPAADQGWTSLFNGRSLNGWEGNQEMFRVEAGAIVGGRLDSPIPHNEFLCTKREFEDFELRLECRVEPATTNAGIQLRSRRKPNDHEVIGYQADVGKGVWGKLYDESRRNRFLAENAEAVSKAQIRPTGWNQYKIRCEGPRIRLWLNGVLTVDYREQDPDIAPRGVIALQIHGGPPAEASYRKLQIRELGNGGGDDSRSD